MNSGVFFKKKDIILSTPLLFKTRTPFLSLYPAASLTAAVDSITTAYTAADATVSSTSLQK